MLVVWKDFEMQLQYFDKKNVFLSFYCNVFLSQYCVQKYCVWIGPKSGQNQIKNKQLASLI